ncbi:ATP-binding protein [Reichenbachiella sp. 5M10]|uniref:ATP-binding protein n=1 Tax=Reichenbachiella sp. 5M10 TaxID=1889772 RepID=UPI0013044CCC|nr:ATP-binding protein [Reichenbachiella sp. 5M10]
MLKYAKEARVSSVDRAIEIVNSAIESAERIGYPQGVAEGSCQLGLLHMILGNHALASSYTHHAEKMFVEQGNRNGEAEALYVLGSIHYKSAKHHVGLDYLYQSLRIQEELKDIQGQSRSLKAIGYIYEAFDEVEKAEETYLKCTALSSSIGDKNGESNACNPLSGLYLKKNDVDRALEVINRSIDLKKESGDKRGLAYAYYGKGKVYLHQDEFDNAREYFFKGLKKHLKVGDKMGIGMCYTRLGVLEFKLGDLDTSKAHFLNTIALGEEIGNQEVLYNAYYYLYLISEREGDMRQALDYHVKYHECKSNVVNSGTKSHLKSLESAWKMESLELEARTQTEKAEFTERKNEELNRFVSRVSHDLKGPLASMIELHKVVEREIEDKQSLYYFELYNKGLKRLNATILDLLELSKLKSLELEYAPINFQEIIRECLDSFHYYANFNLIDFQVSIDPRVEVQSDKRLINTVVQNLLENSIKYSKTDHEQPYVKISVQSMAEDYFALIVEDNGVGIDPVFQEKVFDMFYRANDKVEGSGLGLYILKSAVDKLEGDIQLKSVLDEGTKTIIILPISTK